MQTVCRFRGRRFFYTETEEAKKMFPVINTKETGKKIRETVKKSGYTAETVREKLEISDKGSIYKWFRGETLPSLDNFLALSLLLGVTVNDLVVTL